MDTSRQVSKGTSIETDATSVTETKAQMKSLRERCDMFVDARQGFACAPEEEPIMRIALESFAREIRNEVLEEAAKAVSESDSDGQHELCADEIRALKTNTLAASVSEDK